MIWLKRLITFSLVGAMGFVLVFNIPSAGAFQQYWVFFLLYLALTLLAIPLGVLLSHGEISIAHAVGGIAFLSLGRAALPLIVWAVFLGALIGGMALLLRREYRVILRYRTVRRTVRNLIITSARVTLSFYGAAQLYISLNGMLPLETGNDMAISQLLPYAAFYIGLYLALYVLEWYLENLDVRRILQENWLHLIFALTLPMIYAIPVAVIYTELPIEMFVLAVVGFAISVIVTFSYSRDQYILRQQLDDMHALSTMTRELQADADTATLMKTMQQHLRRILEADSVVMAIMQRDSPKLIYQLEDKIEELDPADERFIHQVLKAQVPLLMEQNVTDPSESQAMFPQRTKVESWVGVPMTVRGRTIGATVLHSAGERGFGPSDVRLLQIIAATFASAIDNAQLYQQQKERVARLNTLNTVSVLLSSTLSLENVLDTITTSAAMLSEANAVAVYLLDSEIESADQDTLVLQRSAGLSDSFLDMGLQPLLAAQMPHSATSVDTSLTEYPPLIVENVHSDERVRVIRDTLQKAGFRSFIELPLASGERLLGAVILYFDSLQTPPDEFTEFLRTFASEAVQAIKNAQLYTRTDEALEKRLFQLSILAAVGQQTNASVDVQVISNVILTFAVEYTKATHGAMILRDRESGVYRVTAFFDEDGETVPDGDILRAAQPEKLLDNFSGDSQLETDGVSRPLMDDTCSQLIVPVRRDNTSVGAIFLESAAVDAFSLEDSHFITQLVNQASIAIDNRLLLQAVMQSNDRMQVILDAMTEAIVLINDQGEIILANPAVRLIGFQQHELVSRKLQDMVTENTAGNMGFSSPQEVDLLLAGFDADGYWSYPSVEYTIQQAHSQLSIERNSIPIRDEDQNMIGLLLVFYDHTKQMQLENTRDEFTRMIVHDLRSPLTAVTTSLYLVRQLLPDSVATGKKIKEITRTSEQVIHKMMRRVDSLLDIAKMESGEITLDHDLVNLSDIVHNVFAELYPLAEERRVQLQNTLSQTLPALHADREKVERVVQNLVDNALKYTADNTYIAVRAHVYDLDPNFVQVNIIDHGPGIPEEDRERLFDRFVQLNGPRTSRRGVGLGLTFCRLVVEAHGGRIWIEDNDNGGSVFAFTLPAATVSNPAGSPPAVEPSPPQSHP